MRIIDLAGLMPLVASFTYCLLLSFSARDYSYLLRIQSLRSRRNPDSKFQLLKRKPNYRTVYVFTNGSFRMEKSSASVLQTATFEELC